MRPLRTPQQFLDAIRLAGLTDADRLRAFAAGVRAAGGVTLDRLGELAVETGLLTRFQVREVLAGRGDQLTLRSYRLIEKLGSGGTSDVFLGVHLGTGERRAVKMLAAGRMHDPVARRRLEREALTAATLNHPNIVRVHEFNCDSRRHPPYLVMEYVDGVSLQAAVALTGTFSAEAAAECGRQVACGLQHAWAARLVHRDIKPANLLLDRTGRVKVLDLGIVRWTEEAGLTKAGKDGRQFLGTVDYLAPEQAVDCSAVDCRADVYSLGATLYFLLAGHPPFTDGTPSRRLLRKQSETPRPIHTLRPDVPTDLSEVIARMLARRPDERFQTPDDAAAALAPFVADGEVSHTGLFERIDRGRTGPLGDQGPSTVASGRLPDPDGPETSTEPEVAPIASSGLIAVLNKVKAKSTAKLAAIRRFRQTLDPTPPPTKRLRPVPSPERPESEAESRRVGRGVRAACGVLAVAALVAAIAYAVR
jgi:serine/threonine protein kinase